MKLYYIYPKPPSFTFKYFNNKISITTFIEILCTGETIPLLKISLIHEFKSRFKW